MTSEAGYPDRAIRGRPLDCPAQPRWICVEARHAPSNQVSSPLQACASIRARIAGRIRFQPRHESIIKAPSPGDRVHTFFAAMVVLAGHGCAGRTRASVFAELPLRSPHREDADLHEPRSIGRHQLASSRSNRRQRFLLTIFVISRQACEQCYGFLLRGIMLAAYETFLSRGSLF